MDPKRFTSIEIDVTKSETLKGICKGVDTVITTIGLTGASTQFNNYDIDFKGNLNLLKEARKARVSKFVYISVINADKGKGIPMVHSKFLFEEKCLPAGAFSPKRKMELPADYHPQRGSFFLPVFSCHSRPDLVKSMHC